MFIKGSTFGISRERLQFWAPQHYLLNHKLSTVDSGLNNNSETVVMITVIDLLVDIR